MVVEKAIADYTDFRIPGLVVTESGTLYFSRHGHSDSNFKGGKLIWKLDET
jgi:hypothetical protein